MTELIEWHKLQKIISGQNSRSELFLVRNDDLHGVVSSVESFAGVRRVLLVSLCGKGAAMWSEIQQRLRSNDWEKPLSLVKNVWLLLPVQLFSWTG